MREKFIRIRFRLISVKLIRSNSLRTIGKNWGVNRITHKKPQVLLRYGEKPSLNLLLQNKIMAWLDQAILSPKDNLVSFSPTSL